MITKYFVSAYNVLDELKQDAIDSMINTEYPASYLLAIALYEYNINDCHINNNNPYPSFIDGDKYNNKTYKDNMETLVKLTFSGSNDITRMNDLLSKVYSIKTINYYIDSYSLKDIDKEILNKYILKCNIVNIEDKTPNIDIYYVKKTCNEKIILKTQDLSEAKRVSNEYNACVFNSRNNKIYGKIEKKSNPKVKDISKIDAIGKGTIVHLDRCNLYKDIFSKIPSRSITGVYTINSDVMIANRYEICPIGIDEPVGFINKKEIEKIYPSSI